MVYASKPTLLHNNMYCINYIPTINGEGPQLLKTICSSWGQPYNSSSYSFKPPHLNSSSVVPNNSLPQNMLLRPMNNHTASGCLGNQRVRYCG